MSLLDDRYTAVKYNGECLTILDIDTLIMDWGVRRFTANFGLVHDVRPVKQVINETERRSTNLVLNPLNNYHPFGGDLCYRYPYVLENSRGKRVDPDFIIAAFFERHPKLKKKATPWWVREFRGKKFWRRGASGYLIDRRETDMAMYRAVTGVVKEDGEPPMKQKFFFLCPWEDGQGLKPAQRNWKKFRKTQYKTT